MIELLTVHYGEKLANKCAEKMREIESFRSLDAELSGNQGRRPSTLIEEVDWSKGADIAV